MEIGWIYFHFYHTWTFGEQRFVVLVFNVFWFFCFHRNLQLKKMNCKLYSSHLDPVWRGNVKFISFGRDLFWMCPPPPHPQPLSPLHCKMLGLWSQEEVGFLVEFFLTFLMNVNLYYLTDYSWCKILSCIKIKKVPPKKREYFYVNIPMFYQPIFYFTTMSFFNSVHRTYS